MVKIAIIVGSDAIHPIYRSEGSYHVDLGGATGIVGPFDFPGDTKAIRGLMDMYFSDGLKARGNGGYESAA